MSECIKEKYLDQELNKQQKLVRIIMEEGERIYKMEDSAEKRRQEEILSFLVEFQSLVSRRILHEFLPN
jgi:hypothetical protein